MKTRTKRIIAAAAVAGCLVTGGTLSNTGRSVLRTVFTSPAGVPATKAPAPRRARAQTTPSPGPSVGLQAEAAQGWDGSIYNSVATGTINYFDPTGLITQQGTVAIYRMYPNNVVVNVTVGGQLTVYGFGFGVTWQNQSTSLTDVQARDSRQWARICSERLFVSMAAAMPYNEPGQVMQDHQRATPQNPAMDLNPPLVFNQVQMTDQLGIPDVNGNYPDQRNLLYQVSAADSLVDSVYWLEPDDPTQPANDPNTDSTEVRVDYGGWQQVNGVTWPFTITHWYGGTVDYQIQLSSIQPNQSGVTTSIFTAPSGGGGVSVVTSPSDSRRGLKSRRGRG